VIVAHRQRLFSQLRGRRFSVYLAPSGTNDDDMGRLTAANLQGDVNLVSQLNAFSLPTSTTWLWRGYFIPQTTTTTWQFRTTSDDASYLWIGTNANSTADTNLNLNNAAVDNGGRHSTRTRTSSNLSLTSGVIYPFAVVAGNDTGAGNITVEWRPDTSTAWASNGTDLYFRNPKAVNGYNP